MDAALKIKWGSNAGLLFIDDAGCRSDGGVLRDAGDAEIQRVFEPYSAALDQQARNTINSVADVARTNPALPITVSGFSAPPDPRLDVNGLSAQRAAAVKQLLIDDGVKPDRIATAANGITDPKTLPNVSVRRVDISLGR